MKTIVCSPENFSHFKNATFAPGDGSPRATVRTDPYCPTWQTYPRPVWWRRWFLREKQKPRERVFYVIDLPLIENGRLNVPPLPIGWSFELKSPWMKLP